jgi:hypothetical protein
MIVAIAIYIQAFLFVASILYFVYETYTNRRSYKRMTSKERSEYIKRGL